MDETSLGTFTREDIENELPPTMLSTTDDNLQIRQDLVSLEQRDQTLSTDIDTIILKNATTRLPISAQRQVRLLRLAGSFWQANGTSLFINIAILICPGLWGVRP